MKNLFQKSTSKFENSIDDLFNELLEKSKESFNKTLEKGMNKEVFDLIHEMRVRDSKNMFYRDNLFELFSILNPVITKDGDNHNFIRYVYDFNFIVSITNFLNSLWWNIEDDGYLSFNEINTKKMIKDTGFYHDGYFYMFSTRHTHEGVLEYFVQEHKSMFSLIGSNKIRLVDKVVVKTTQVTYPKFVSIIKEILDRDNWFNKDPENLRDEFDERKAFEKYFKGEKGSEYSAPVCE